ncbi:probable serine/threonine-protein kinase cdc7 [Oppia nitens]|uniref:probable serine/threonine-protein kinase cdc7 n=1 Tax=Oppia nitens TaxID=1686743 RepID=UPI0023DCD0B1|nr:probable serine/threonine-protein kinase cdc7 [Oppia nitens]
MDYRSLLSLADKKQEMKDSDNEFLVRKRASGGQSSGPNIKAIEAFKARKEREEMEKLREKRREKEKLMSLRAQNSKSVKKAMMMKTRTKDNDFSRIVLTDAQIEEQRRVEEKLRQKGSQDVIHNRKRMNDTEDKVVFNQKKNLNQTRISHYNNNNNNNNLNNMNKMSQMSTKSKNDEKVRSDTNKNGVKSFTAKPLMNYEQLMSLATKKAKTEKTSLQEDFKTVVEEKKQMRPMTQKEKERLKEEMYYKQRANKGLARLPDPETTRKHKSINKPKDNTKNYSYTKMANNYESNLNNNKNNGKLIGNGKSNNNNNNNNNSSGTDRKMCQTPQRSDKSVINNNNNKSINVNQRSGDRFTNEKQSRNIPLNRQNSRQSSGSASNKSAIINKMNNRLTQRDNDYREKYAANQRVQQKPINNNNNYKAYNERARPPSPPSPPPPPPRRPVAKLPPIGSTYRRGMYEDPGEYMDDEYDEEEEDDDMDDFIDDGPQEAEENDYSSHIREIFGYDKRKYRNIVDDDDDIQESSFVQCMKEDARSARLGLIEDLEEERKEEEERKRYLLEKKKRFK